MNWFTVLLALFIYFIPTVNAFGSKRKNKGAVLALNLLLGWTGIGWIIALIWSCMVD